MKEIPLTRGKRAIVDDEDYPRLVSMGKWQASCLRGNWYATMMRKIDGKRTSILMHRVVIGVPKELVTDHIDHDGLNNRRSNLRACTRRQNNQNQAKLSTNKSGYKGVSWANRSHKWQVFVRHEYFGLFETKEEAARKYNEIAAKLFGEFALLNPVAKPEGDSELPDEGLPEDCEEDD